MTTAGETKPWRQCRSTYTTVSRRTANTVFCEKAEGHEGEHKGFRKRWDEKGLIPRKEPRT